MCACVCVCVCLCACVCVSRWLVTPLSTHTARAGGDRYPNPPSWHHAHMQPRVWSGTRLKTRRMPWLRVSARRGLAARRTLSDCGGRGGGRPLVLLKSRQSRARQPFGPGVAGWRACVARLGCERTLMASICADSKPSSIALVMTMSRSTCEWRLGLSPRHGLDDGTTAPRTIMVFRAMQHAPTVGAPTWFVPLAM